MNNKKIFFALLALALAGLACQTSILGVPVAITTPTAPATSTPLSTVAPSPTLPAGPPDAGRAGEICFDNIAGGTVRVRECPGLGCREVGVLVGGSKIAAPGERRDVDGATWLRITSPVEGWVSARYVCEIAVDSEESE